MGIKPVGIKDHATVIYPLLMLGLFFVVPFSIMLAVSFAHRIQGGAFKPGFELSNYARFFSTFFAEVLGFSLMIAGLAAIICVVVGFPFTWFLTQMNQRAQVIWLVFILSILSLSEVIVGFAWSTLLSGTAGISNLFVWLGLMAEPVAWSPGFAALLCGLCYLGFPYTVLLLYPTLSRLEPELPEAARMLGASPICSFFTIILPGLRNAIISALVMVFVFTLGAYLLPQMLGRPQHWTLSVLITDQAIYQSNLPFAAAMAIFLMLVSLAMVGITIMLGKKPQ